MLPAYRDITSRIADPILWWNEHGVPRYDPWHPDMMGIYDILSLLVEIRCQACDRSFLVGQGWSQIQLYLPHRDWFQTPEEVAGQYVFGDPPQHSAPDGGRCAGETMSCIEVRIVEAWYKDQQRLDLVGPFR